MSAKDKIIYSYNSNQKVDLQELKRPNTPQKIFNTKMMISKAYLNKKPRKEKSLREEINKKINGLMDRN